MGQWLGGTPLPPTRALEQQLGISHATMIKVLRRAVDERLIIVAPRQPVVVHPAAAERAREVLGSLERRRSGRCLAVLVPERIWPLDRSNFCRELTSSLEVEAAKAGWTVEPVCWPVLEQTRFVETLAAAGFAAALPVGISTDYIESLHVLRRREFPTVLWNCDSPYVPLPAVLLDEVGGVRQIAALLADLGHRSLCLATWAVETRMKRRGHCVAAWLDYLAEIGLMDSSTVPVLHLTQNHEGGVVLADGLLAMRMKPTAIVFAYGAAAVGFLSVPEHQHIRVPEQLSLAAFGRPKMLAAASWCPPLTAVTFDEALLARQVIDMVSQLCDARKCESITLPMFIHRTDSIAPPPSPAVRSLPVPSPQKEKSAP